MNTLSLSIFALGAALTLGIAQSAQASSNIQPAIASGHDTAQIQLVKRGHGHGHGHGHGYHHGYRGYRGYGGYGGYAVYPAYPDYYYAPSYPSEGICVGPLCIFGN